MPVLRREGEAAACGRWPNREMRELRGEHVLRGEEPREGMEPTSGREFEMKIDEHVGWCDAVVYTYDCPKCGTESDVHIGEDADATDKPRYCPACGAPIDRMEIETVCVEDQMPVRAHEADAGADLRASEYATIGSKQFAVVSTGVRVSIPEGYFGLLAARSSLWWRGLLMANGVGIIDAGFTGEIKVPLYNAGNTPSNVLAGERIAQLVIVPCELPTFRRVEELGDTERGEGGFGSTGVE